MNEFGIIEKIDEYQLTIKLDNEKERLFVYHFKRWLPQFYWGVVPLDSLQPDQISPFV